MKRIFSIMKNKYFKIIFWTSLLVLALVLAFRVPTRLVVRDINQNSNLTSKPDSWAGPVTRPAMGEEHHAPLLFLALPLPL